MLNYWGTKILRELVEFEVENLAFLTRYDIDFGLLEPTMTGLGKSIMDATFDYRSFLKRQQAHDYDVQPQGTVYKRQISARIVSIEGDVIEARASLYRPETKLGDPRVWFSQLKRYCSPGDILVSIWINGIIWLLNASKVQFSNAVEVNYHYRHLLRPAMDHRETVFEELLEAMRGISARGFIPTLRNGDTGVGHLLETELGIKANSSKAPDYKGVEIKSTRGKKTKSLTLLAKVPDWALSQLPTIRAFWNEFGYDREDGRGWRLNCTVSGVVWNSQGLRLAVDEKAGLLHEISNSSTFNQPLTWELQALRDALAKKHADTFWVKAESRIEGPVELIRYHSVIQTSKPIVQQLAPMLSAGSITVDHVINIKKDGSHQSPREAGPLFKVVQRNFTDLFPEPKVHNLLPLSTRTEYSTQLSKNDLALSSKH